ncbi:hypothetical protein L6252_03200, partial [Candidatus Parcubacteria bacterium]|nr:hypothetical protein [Candidatus Parcubacteria bacterium]
MKEKKSLVGSMPVEDIAGMMIDFWTKMRSGALTREQLAAFLRKKNPFEIKGGNEWINELVAKERATHIAFFGQVISSRFDYSILEKTLEKYDQAKVAKWAGVGLQVAFLPPVKMEQSACFPGFQVKPNNWFYEKIAEGKVDKKALCLGDID